jgi:hypothetical protein
MDRHSVPIIYSYFVKRKYTNCTPNTFPVQCYFCFWFLCRQVPMSMLHCKQFYVTTDGIRNPDHLFARWFAEPISSTLKMEATCSSETSGATQRTTRRPIPEDDTLHNHRCENLKSYQTILFISTPHGVKRTSKHRRNSVCKI